MEPDQATKTRLEKLAIVGNMLFQISNDNVDQTNYFLAKSSLQSFSEDISNLELDQKTMSGMMNLIKYLETKIDKRQKQAGGEFSKD